MVSDTKIHVLMFPWLAHGHISPFLELGKKLVDRNNFIIHLCSSKVNLNSVREKIDSSFSGSINLIEFEIPSYADLPSNLHTTNGLPPHLMSRLKEAFDESAPNFSNILGSIKPDLLIYDFLQPWAPKSAAEHGIPAVEFVTSSATMTSLMMHNRHNPGIKFPFSNIYYRDHEQAVIDKMRENAVEIGKARKRLYDCFDMSCNVILIKTFKEIEGKYIDYLSDISGKKAVPVGHLVQDPNRYDDDDKSGIIEWLDKKGKNSTVFVSFGSEYFLSEEDLKEIAHGLELSRVNFIWVVRFPKGEKLRVEEAFLQECIEKVGERGLIVEGWVPQNKILMHSSIGGFVSHCGWSSVNESMKLGVPIIAMPMHIDQPINARLVEEIGVGVEAVRDSLGKLHRETVAAVIKQVVVEKAGETVRNKAREMSHDMAMKGDEEIDVVVEELMKLVKKE